MDSEPRHPRDTRELVALWSVAKEEHLVQRLGATLERLARHGVLPPMTERQVALLAHMVHLAADPTAGPAVALQFLETQTEPDPEAPPGG